MITMPVLFGVDVVHVDRITRSLLRHGSVYRRHVTSPAERDLHAETGIATAATVAVKECLVKAVGGRPPGFSWRDFRAGDDIPSVGRERAGRVLALAVSEVESSTRVTLNEHCAYEVCGVSAAAALARLATGPHTPCRPAPAVVGMARWGRVGNLLVALAVLIPIPIGAK